jgi:hypothetical protein
MPLLLALMLLAFALQGYQEHRPWWLVTGFAVFSAGMFRFWWRGGHLP